ncbi:MAG: hypothetical protein NC078_08210, partial [Ruminococcus sp.]|nr:hypothetical protein [Ruminococcus sp.]
RGLILSDGRLLEYQTALPCRGASESERHTVTAEIIERVNRRDAALQAAEKVKVLPLSQSYGEFYENAHSENAIPVGYDTDDISVYGLSLTDMFCYSVSGADERGISLVLGNLMYAARQAESYIYCVKLKQDIKLPLENADKICRDKASVSDMLAALREPFHQRAVLKKEFLAENPDGDFASHICGSNKRIFVFIDSMNEFINMIYDSGNEENMHTISETYFKNGKGMGIYFIAGFDSTVYGQNYYQTACRYFTEHKQAIHLGGRYDKQKVVDVSMTMSQMSRPDEHFMGMTNYGGNVKIFVPGGQSAE